MLLGSDPELFIMNSRGTRVRDIRPFGIDQYGDIGFDHNGRILELRPKPAATPEELTERIKSLLLTVKGIIPVRYRICALTYLQNEPDGAGCHLHVSLDSNTYSTAWWEGLSTLCGVLLGIPCLLLHNDYSDVIGRYGRPHGREAPYGDITGKRYCWFKSAIGHRHPDDVSLKDLPDGLEYRSIGGIIMKSPELFNTTVSIFYSIVKAYLGGYSFPKRVFNRYELYSNKDKALELMERYEVWEILSKICEKDHIKYIKEIIDNGGVVQTNDSILPAWVGE